MKDLVTGDQSIFVNASALSEVVPTYSSYSISYDGNFILFAVNVSSISYKRGGPLKREKDRKREKERKRKSVREERESERKRERGSE